MSWGCEGAACRNLPLATGGLLGGVASGPLLLAPLFADARRLIARAFQGTPIGRNDLIAISIAAGLGEELLFRGAPQRWLGAVWPPGIFLMPRGWVPLRGWARAGYVLFVVAAGVSLAALFAAAGLLAAIVAHASTDAVILLNALHEHACGNGPAAPPPRVMPSV